jgi:hypothetical protein
VRGDVRVDSETLLITDFMNFKIKPAQSLLLVTDFVNLKIKPTQSFKDAYIGMMYVRVFIEVNTHTYMNIYICIVFIKKLHARRSRLASRVPHFFIPLRSTG